METRQFAWLSYYRLIILYKLRVHDYGYMQYITAYSISVIASYIN